MVDSQGEEYESFRKEFDRTMMELNKYDESKYYEKMKQNNNKEVKSNAT